MLCFHYISFWDNCLWSHLLPPYVFSLILNNLISFLQVYLQSSCLLVWFAYGFVTPEFNQEHQYVHVVDLYTGVYGTHQWPKICRKILTLMQHLLTASSSPGRIWVPWTHAPSMIECLYDWVWKECRQFWLLRSWQ